MTKLYLDRSRINDNGYVLGFITDYTKPLEIEITLAEYILLSNMLILELFPHCITCDSEFITLTHNIANIPFIVIDNGFDKVGIKIEENTLKCLKIVFGIEEK